MGDGDCGIAEQGRAEDQKPVENCRQPHRDRAKEHRHHRVIENPSRAIKEKYPARGVGDAEQRKQRDIREPENHRAVVQGRDLQWKLFDRQRQRTGSHGDGEPVGREIANDLGKRLGLVGSSRPMIPDRVRHSKPLPHAHSAPRNREKRDAAASIAASAFRTMESAPDHS